MAIYCSISLVAIGGPVTVVQVHIATVYRHLDYMLAHTLYALSLNMTATVVTVSPYAVLYV